MAQHNKLVNGGDESGSYKENNCFRSESKGFDSRRLSKGPAKDMATLREELKQEQQKSIKKYGEAIMKRDQETTISVENLRKARHPPNALDLQSVQAADSQACTNKRMPGANDTLQAARAPGSWLQGDESTARNSKLMDVWDNTSEISGDEDTMSIDSTAPMRDGKTINRRRPGDAPTFAGWNGDTIPTPINWHTEPTFNNSSDSFLKAFHQWLEGVNLQTMGPSESGPPRQVLDLNVVRRGDLHADGLTFVPKEKLKIPIGGEHRYGYNVQDADEVQWRLNESTEHDWKDWGKLDPGDGENAEHGEETAEILCRNMNAHWAKERAEKLRQAHRNRIQADEIRFATDVQENNMVPKANIYIRPAIRADLNQILFIFNSYVENSARTSELEKIQLSEMHDRLDDSENENLPFLVAVLKDFKKTKHTAARTTSTEKVVGYGLATDFCLPDRAEKFTAELELYVHPEWLHKKLGSCLLDKLLEVCDRGYIRRQGYIFHSDEPKKYYPGGDRDLLSLVFVLRYWQSRDDLEYEGIKVWLSEFDFEEKGVLERVGIKKGRM